MNNFPANEVCDSINVNGVAVTRLNSGAVVFEDINGTVVRAESNVALTALFEKAEEAGA